MDEGNETIATRLKTATKDVAYEGHTNTLVNLAEGEGCKDQERNTRVHRITDQDDEEQPAYTPVLDLGKKPVPFQYTLEEWINQETSES
jgi:hypothetical protein